MTPRSCVSVFQAAFRYHIEFQCMIIIKYFIVPGWISWKDLPVTFSFHSPCNAASVFWFLLPSFFHVILTSICSFVWLWFWKWHDETASFCYKTVAWCHNRAIRDWSRSQFSDKNRAPKSFQRFWLFIVNNIKACVEHELLYSDISGE